ncbi:hypothetical protein [Thermosynechococcus sp.]|uniref:hypothetical protein n=1 Tax=Thermosynechococcus sp. TaxID=2814275 RepID=UPI00391A4338
MKHSKAVSLFLSLGIATTLVTPASATSNQTSQMPEVKADALRLESLGQTTHSPRQHLLLAGSEEGGEEGGYGERGESGKRRRRWWW